MAFSKHKIRKSKMVSAVSLALTIIYASPSARASAPDMVLPKITRESIQKRVLRLRARILGKMTTTLLITRRGQHFATPTCTSAI